jgi:hypothetical protein
MEIKNKNKKDTLDFWKEGLDIILLIAALPRSG